MIAREYIGPAGTAFPGIQSQWNGYDQYEFNVEGRLCRVVVPQKPAKGKPWSWRMVFWDAFANSEVALLEKGYHVAFIDCSDWLGSPTRMKQCEAFFRFLTEEYGLSKKPVLIGMSRGGFCAFRWAVLHPDKVSCLYVDNPRFNFADMPWKHADLWKQYLQAWELPDDLDVSKFPNPLDTFQPLIEKKVPILSVCGEADAIVSFERNTKLFAEKFETAGGIIEVIAKSGVDHHPHGLDDPVPIVNFILKNTK